MNDLIDMNSDTSNQTVEGAYTVAQDLSVSAGVTVGKYESPSFQVCSVHVWLREKLGQGLLLSARSEKLEQYWH